MQRRAPALAVPSALRLVEPLGQRLVAGLVLGPLVAAFLGRPLAWLAVPLGVLLALGLLSRGGYFGPRVTVDERGVWYGRALLLPRGAVDFAYVARVRGVSKVRFLAGGDVTAELEVGDAEEGLRVLEAMRLGTGDRVARLGSTLPARFSFALGIFALALGLSGVVFGLAIGMAWLAVTATIAVLVSPGLLMNQEIRVGADGLTLSAGFSTRFVRYADVLGVEETRRGIVVHLQNGERVLGATPVRLWGVPRREVKRALVETIRAELSRYRALTPPSGASRIERAVEGRAAESGPVSEGTFRIAPLPLEELVEIAACPTASDRARELASRALCKVEAEWAREELARAADACASPALRTVMRAYDVKAMVE